MKYFSHSNQQINAECQNCGRVLKVPHEKCIAVLGGFSVTPAVICKCGTVSNFIEDRLSNYQKNMGRTRKKNDHHLPELIDLIERFLPLNKWGFRMSAQCVIYSGKLNSVLIAENYYGLGYPIVFYDSEKCRIQVEYAWSSREYERSIHIQYGRLETPDDAKTLLSNAQKTDYHILWHSVFCALDFLDGLSPQEAKKAKHPRLLSEFERSDVAKGIKSEPEKDALFHATIWETYGQRLFDIFDTQNKDLWEHYSMFVNEFFR
jgi:hypothetical protein